MKTRWLTAALCMAVALSLTGCGGSAGNKSAAQDSAAWIEAPMEMKTESMAMEESAAEEVFETETMDMVAGGTMEDGASGVNSETGIDSVKNTAQKLIKTVNMEMETKEFDKLLPAITDKVTELGGYVENSEISGNSYRGGGRRYAWLSLRIPADKLDGFITIASEMGNVTYKNESVEDITLQYVDVQSHKEALMTEQERLLTLLKKAENMEDIIQIETRLSEIRYELQSYESRLRTMDNRVTYSTVSVSISEVERITEVQEKTFWEEITYRLSDNLYDIGQGIRNFAIRFISSLPYLVIWAVVIVVAVLILKKPVRKYWKKLTASWATGSEKEEKEEKK